MDEFFQYLERLHPLSDELKASLVGRTHKETYRKNRPLLSTGTTSDWIGYLEGGLAKVCYDLPGGQERIICFLKAGDTVCSMTSYLAQTPSRLAIVALDETIIRKLTRKEGESIAEKHPSFHTHLRKISEAQTMQLEAHYLLIAENPKDRLAKIPDLCSWMLKDKRIKDYMIADYLGVHRVTFGRWRADQ